MALYILLSAAESKDYNLNRLEHKGSLIEVMYPAEWNGKLLVWAHGYRPAASPLRCKIYDDQFTQDLISRGWMIAKTSYRRNGVIIRDAIEDLEILNQYVVENYGKPKEKYLHGASMGGIISVLIAEQADSGYDGVLALGAALQMKEETNPLELNYQPQIPILYLSNKTEVERPKDYIANFKSGIKPRFWMIDRPGHCNENPFEMQEAFNALLDFAAGKDIEDDRTILHDMQNLIISEVEFMNNEIHVPLVKGSSSFRINLHKSDLEKIGIEHKSYYKLSYNDRYYYAFWGDTYSDVPNKFWISFFNATGEFKLARNFGNAIPILNYEEDDIVVITKLDEQPDFPTLYNEEAVNLGIKAWEEITKDNFEESIKLGLQAAKLDPQAIWIKTNLATAYLYNNQFEKAKEVVLGNLGKPYKSHQLYFDDSLLEDWEEFRSSGEGHPDMEKILELIKQ